MRKDELVIAEAFAGAVRIHAARTTAMVEAARRAHDCLPTSIAALGRTMSVAALMASDLKSPMEHVQIRLDGGGPCGLINVQADGNCRVRGYIQNPHVHIVKADHHEDVGRAVGIDGMLRVSRDMGLKEPFTGVVPLQTGEIGQDFAYYYAVSEQTPSVVSVGVLIDTDYSIAASGGLLVQILPGAPEEIIDRVEKVMQTMRPMTTYMQADQSVADIIHCLYPDAAILQHRDVRWYCGCSKEHFGEALALLREKDLCAMIEEDHGADITCQYCGRKYHYTQAELQRILAEKSRV